MSVLDVEELTTPFPREAIKQREGARGKMLSYVSTDTVIRRLNRCAGEWSWTIRTVEWRDDLCIVTGTLTIPGLGSRDGIGVQKVNERGGEDLVKGGSSDALKMSATLFGVGLELYGDDIEERVEQRRQAHQPPPVPIAQQQNEARLRYDNDPQLSAAYTRFAAKAQEFNIPLKNPQTGKLTIQRVEAAVRDICNRAMMYDRPIRDDELPTLEHYRFAMSKIGQAQDEPATPGVLMDVPQTTEAGPANYTDAETTNRGKVQPNSHVKAAQS